jgi:signal transduction histidine kinase
VRGFAERTGITVEFHGKLPGNLLAADQRTVIYRVAQESLNNVAKHASATHVDVILWREGGLAILEIRDNGRGFSRPPRRVEPDRQRLGLLGMEERVRLVNGRFNLESRPSAGTIVRVEIPLEPTSPHAAEAGGGASPDSSPTPVQKQTIPL